MKKTTFWQQVGIGIKSYIDALSFVFNKGLWIYFLYPLLLTVVMFYLSFSLAGILSSELEQWLKNFLGLNGETDGWLSYLTGFLSFFLAIALKIVFFFVYSTFSKYIILILMSPAMALLSERTEEILTGRKYKFNAAQFLNDVLRGIVIALRNMFIEFSFIFLCLFVACIPFIGWLTPVFLAVVSFYYYGFSMIDYCSERKRLSIRQSVSYIRSNKGLAMGNGFIFSFLFNIPFVGVIVAPVLASVAASIAVVEIDKN
jgi:CysZ protein